MPSPLPPNIKELFTELRYQARTRDEIAEWFATYPQTLLGDFQIPENALAKVELRGFNVEMLNAQFALGVETNANIAVTVPYTPDNYFSDELDIVSVEQSFTVNHTLNLRLSMQDWALATAVYAAYYCTKTNDGVRKVFAHVAEELNVALPKFFPGMTLDSLVAMYDSGLISDSPKAHLRVQAIMDLLYTSRQQPPLLVTPDNLL